MWLLPKRDLGDANPSLAPATSEYAYWQSSFHPTIPVCDYIRAYIYIYTHISGINPFSQRCCRSHCAQDGDREGSLSRGAAGPWAVSSAVALGRFCTSLPSPPPLEDTPTLASKEIALCSEIAADNLCFKPPLVFLLPILPHRTKISAFSPKREQLLRKRASRSLHFPSGPFENGSISGYQAFKGEFLKGHVGRQQKAAIHRRSQRH